MNIKTQLTNVTYRTILREMVRDEGLKVGTLDGNIARARNPIKYPWVVWDDSDGLGFCSNNEVCGSGHLTVTYADFLNRTVGKRKVYPVCSCRCIRPATETIDLSDGLELIINRDGSADAGCQHLSKTTMRKAVKAWLRITGE